MKNILVFCFFPAFVPPCNGGQSRLFNFYRSLSNWHNVRMLTSSHIGIEEEVINHGVGFVERRIPKDDYFAQQYAFLEPFSGGGDLSGPAIAACGMFPTRLHHAYLEEYEKADVICHDSPFTFEYDLFIGIDSKPRIYNAYNCETKLYQQLHKGKNHKTIHNIVHLSEKRLLESTDLILYCNEDDLAAFHEISPTAQFDSVYAPNGMTPIPVPTPANKSSDHKFRAVFVGSGHPPNMHAAEFIANILAPQLPEITFDIVGSCLLEGRYPPNVLRHGMVDDDLKTQILSRANLALNPMGIGSGSNVKVLEYFAFGLPVLSTIFGMRGIHVEAGREFLEASLEQFPTAIRNAAGKPEVLATVATAGRNLALGQYTWESIAKPVAERVEELVRWKTNTQDLRFVLALNDYDSFERIGGGATRTRGLYTALSEWSPVVFVSFSNDGTLKARKHANGIFVINVPKNPEHYAELLRINSQFHVSVDDIVASRHCQTNPYLNSIYCLLRQSARCIVVEHCYMAGLPYAYGDRFVYSSQNNETELKNRLLGLHPLKAELLRNVECIERVALECSAATIAVSQEDAESLVRGRQTAGPVIVVRNGAVAPESGEAVNRAQEALREKIGARSVVFLGSAHMPNVVAAQYITERLAPQCRDVQFHLIGSVCNSIISMPTNVHSWGVVDDVTKSAVMQSCALAINPMTSGSGSNVKLADFLGNGLFVVSTEFGQRGYPPSIREHVEVVPIEQFRNAIYAVLRSPEHLSADAKRKRRDLFERELEMQSLAARFVSTLQELEVKRKRVLYVAYRYVAPVQGGAEANIEKFVSALGHSGEFDVDVVAPEISGIHNFMRFSENYSFDRESGAPVDIPNVRFARFPVDPPKQSFIDSCLKSVWRAQPRFEKAVSQQLANDYVNTALAWGWGYPEGDAEFASRWAFTECGLYLADSAKLQLKGYAPSPMVITAHSKNDVVAGPWSVEGEFNLTFQAGAGELEFRTSAPVQKHDPRPLGFKVTRLTVAGNNIDLAGSTLIQRHLPSLAADTAFQMLDRAAEETRVAQNVRLTDGRGPWSASLERFIANHVAEYDLVVTHNNIFRPAVVAIEEAKRQGVPSILIPHAHLDDDFYHFPDLLNSARDASLVLAVPKAACDFLTEKGCNVRYLTAGCDATEQFILQDQEAFRQVHTSSRPFVLVLGRKAGAKGYQLIINAVDQLNREGMDLQTVLIGPDDDGIPVDSPNAVYLGRQPRNVVRGALLSCLALCNMSSSESFGIVLLEAWLAGKPVIANKNCAAFHDMAVDGINAILTSPGNLTQAIRDIVIDPSRALHLSTNGKTMPELYSWEKVCSSFVQMCIEFAN